MAQLGTFPSAADGGRSEEKGVAEAWRLASEQARADRALASTGMQATFGSMQALSYREFSKTLKTLVNTDFFGHYSFQKNTDKMF